MSTKVNPEVDRGLGLKTTRRAWLLLSMPPVVFLVVIVAASIYFGATTGADPQAIAESVAGSTPVLLLVIQTIMLLMLWAVLRAEHLSLRHIGWRIAPGQDLWRECFIGAVPGLILALLYLSVLSPLLTTAQREIGDYVPPGELLPALTGAPLAFFLANVVLAPFVEESIYRGYGIAALRRRLSVPAAVVVSCSFFGLLHWAGGLWYVLLTGIVAGSLFAGLYLWRRNVVAAYAAHLTLNVVEFLVVWLWV